MINIILSYLNKFKLDEFKSRVKYNSDDRINFKHKSNLIWSPYNFRNILAPFYLGVRHLEKGKSYFIAKYK